MKKSVKSFAPKKRIYWIVAGSIAIVLIGFGLTMAFIKLNFASQQTGTDINSKKIVKQTDANPISSSDSASSSGITATPLNKTLDQAKAEGAYSEGSSSYNDSTSYSNSSSSTDGENSPVNQQGSSPETTATSIQPQGGQPGSGLDANTVNQLRSFGIREGDLAKIDRMVADGFDPKEIAKSLRDNGNQNLAAIMEQVPRRGKEEFKNQEEQKHEEKKHGEKGKKAEDWNGNGQNGE